MKSVLFTIVNISYLESNTDNMESILIYSALSEMELILEEKK